MLNRLSIKYKIGFIALIGFMGFFVYQAATYRLSLNISNSLQSILSEDFAVLKFSNDIQVGFSELDKLYQASLAESDMDTLLEADAKATDMKLRFELLRDNFKLDDPYFAELHEAFNVYVDQTSRHTASVLTNTLGYEKTLSGYAEISLLRERYQETQARFLNERYGSFEKQLKAIESEENYIVRFGLVLGSVLSAILLVFSIIIIRSLISAFSNAVTVAEQVASGNLEQSIEIFAEDETGQLMQSLQAMRNALKKQSEDNQYREKIQVFMAGLNETMRGDKNIKDMADAVLQYLASEFHAQIGAFYLFEQDRLGLVSSYAYTLADDSKTTFLLGEGTVGQVAAEGRPQIMNEIPDQYMAIESGIGRALPRSILLFPVMFEGKLKGVIEIAAFRRFSDDDLYLMKRCNDAIAIALNSAQSRVKLAGMLAQTQEQAGELNRQRQELALFNQQLKGKTEDLDRQKNEILRKNIELENSERQLIEKSSALELSGRYKSQFLSTMSHELRTPLNSILILSDALMNNRYGHLSERDVEHARVINSAGAELLALINDILDLSKVEEGKMEVVIDEISTASLAKSLTEQFDLMARERGLDFEVSIAGDLPEVFYTDHHRLKQILKNFISNGLKFTEKGGVYVSVSRPSESDIPPGSLLAAGNSIIFSVRDTGVGIEQSKQSLVFEAFQQVDGTTSRKFGGTGLGLTISRELAKLLGGHIFLHSEGDGKGSVFSLLLPLGDVEMLPKRPALSLAPGRLEKNGDNRPVMAVKRLKNLPSAPQVLVVEDNPVFIKVLDAVFSNNNLPVAIASNGKQALEKIAVNDFPCLVVDLSLPDYSGLDLLKEIRSNEKYREKFIIVFTAEDVTSEKRHEIEMYANRIITKSPQSIMELCDLARQVISSQPGSQGADDSELSQGAIEGIHVLLVDDDVRNRYSIASTLKEEGVVIETASSGLAALEILRKNSNIELVLLDIMMPEMDGYEVLRQIRCDKKLKHLPVIALTAKAMVGDREKCLEAGASDYLSKPVDPRVLLESIHAHVRHRRCGSVAGI